MACSKAVEQPTGAPWKFQGDELIGPDGRKVLWIEASGCADPECCGSPDLGIYGAKPDKKMIELCPELLAGLREIEDGKKSEWHMREIAKALIDRYDEACK